MTLILTNYETGETATVGLLCEDGRWRWYGTEGEDTEVSGATEEAALEAAYDAWGRDCDMEIVEGLATETTPLKQVVTVVRYLGAGAAEYNFADYVHAAKFCNSLFPGCPLSEPEPTNDEGDMLQREVLDGTRPVGRILFAPPQETQEDDPTCLTAGCAAGRHEECPDRGANSCDCDCHLR